MLSHEKFIQLVDDMRTQQRAYFAGNKSALSSAKSLEKQVDKELVNYKHGKKSTVQSNLFSDGGK